MCALCSYGNDINNPPALAAIDHHSLREQRTNMMVRAAIKSAVVQNTLNTGVSIRGGHLVLS